MNPSLVISRNTMSAAIALAIIDTQQYWDEVVLDVGVEALEYAKANAPWTDRTGMAREGLDVDVDTTGQQITLTMYHTMDYGQWLETSQGGRLAIIMPTLEKYGQEIKRRIE